MIVKSKYISLDEINHCVSVVFYTDVIKNAYEAALPEKVAAEMRSNPSINSTEAESLVRARWPMGYALNIQLYETPTSADALAEYVGRFAPVAYLEKLEQIAAAPMNLKFLRDLVDVEKVVVLSPNTTTIPIGKL